MIMKAEIGVIQRINQEMSWIDSNNQKQAERAWPCSQLVSDSQSLEL